MNTNLKFPLVNILVLFSHTLVIVFLLIMHISGSTLSSDNLFHMIVLTLLLLDAAYISSKNIKGNVTLTNFELLLMLTGWQLLFSLYEDSRFCSRLSTLLSVLVLFQSIAFVITFLFQDSAFRGKKTIYILLGITCAGTILSCFISEKIFALAFLSQCLTALILLIYIFFSQFDRVKFVFMSQRRHIIFSFLFSIIPFGCYISVYQNRPDYLENLGSYLMIVLCFTSIHSIVRGRKATDVSRKYTQLPFYITAAVMYLLFSGIIINIFSLPYVFIFIQIYFICVLIILYHLFVFCRFTHSSQAPLNCLPDSAYYYALTQLRHEEEMKTAFANYLHDDVLQYILSIKNMMTQSDNPDIQRLIQKTLASLNISIRKQMREYHPALTRSLTLKENIESLIDTAQNSFPERKCNIHLECDDNIFLVIPYDTIIYRALKELLMNSFKHSGASEIWILLLQQNGLITLELKDNGKGMGDLHSASASQNHHGLASIRQQIHALNGKFTVDSQKTAGASFKIILPMKGEDSYENFIDR